jgi:hypothetical protein
VDDRDLERPVVARGQVDALQDELAVVADLVDVAGAGLR